MVDEIKKPIYEGNFTIDPAANPQVGDSFQIETILIEPLENDITVYRPLHTAKGTVLTFHFANKLEHDVDGSAVLVAPGIALTARHVIEPHRDKLINGIKYSFLMGICNNSVNMWAVKELTILPHCDIAILGLELNSSIPADKTFRQAAISTRLPKIGERIQILGFRAKTLVPESNASLGPQIDAGLVVSAGVITNRFPLGRDSAMLPWPVLEVDCPSWGGMSGGPVFDKHGHLIGLLCTSFDLLDESGPSYVSLLWPVLASKFRGGWPKAIFTEPRSLIELAPDLCKIDRPESVWHQFDELSGKTSTQYKIWEE
ncbi:MAG: hypothetical protein RJA87_494 [Pseudomonadota bacterium]|jgi:hypothetical protein